MSSVRLEPRKQSFDGVLHNRAFGRSRSIRCPLPRSAVLNRLTFMFLGPALALSFCVSAEPDEARESPRFWKECTMANPVEYRAAGAQDYASIAWQH